MWAVGRLAFLSRGRAAVNPKPDAAPTPARPPGAPSPPQPPPPIRPAIPPEIGLREPVLQMAIPPSATREDGPVVPGLLQRIVLRVKGLFRSMFG